MNRRGFLKMFGLAAGGVLLDQAIPNGRVWSFPKDVVIAKSPLVLGMEQYADYVSFSEMIADTAIDPLVDEVAAELAQRYAQRWTELYA